MHSESQWRYRAYRLGLRLVKYRQDSTAYEKYGPFAFVDLATNQLVETGLSPEDVERRLYAHADQEVSRSVSP